MSSSNTERTFVMVKPDGVQRGLVGDVIRRFEQRGFQLIAAKLLTPNQAMLDQHYAEHVAKSFYPKLAAFMTSGPVMAMVWQGKEVVKTGRRMLGETHPLNSAPGTIRGDFGIDLGRNICHGSDGVEAAEREISLWFPEDVQSYTKTLDAHLYE
jgi:nucleoside-diphosphate kinase